MVHRVTAVSSPRPHTGGREGCWKLGARELEWDLPGTFCSRTRNSRDLGWRGALQLFERLQSRNEWKFFGILPLADRTLAVAWWAVLVLRGILPAVFAIAIGILVGAVQRGENLMAPLILMGAVFMPLQILSPLHQAIGANLGNKTAAWLYDRLTWACVRPPGMGHLESPKLTSDLTMARDFDLCITGPPMSISMDFIARGLVEMVAGLASAAVLAGYAWWAPLVLAGAWLATHWLLRESGVWRDRNTEEVRQLSDMLTTRIASRSSRWAPRRSDSLGSRAGSLNGSARGADFSSSCAIRRQGCASDRSPGAWRWCLARTSWSSGRWRVLRLTAHWRSIGWLPTPVPPWPRA